MAIEERIGSLLATANLNTLKRWVEEDMSMLQNLDAGDKLIFTIIAPLLKEINIDADRVMHYLKQNRPDMYDVVTKEWIEKQVAELNGKV